MIALCCTVTIHVRSDAAVGFLWRCDELDGDWLNNEVDRCDDGEISELIIINAILSEILAHFLWHCIKGLDIWIVS